MTEFSYVTKLTPHAPMLAREGYWESTNHIERDQNRIRKGSKVNWIEISVVLNHKFPNVLLDSVGGYQRDNGTDRQFCLWI